MQNLPNPLIVQRDRSIMSDLKEGLEYKEIGARYGLSIARIAQIAKSNGESRGTRRLLTEEEMDTFYLRVVVNGEKIAHVAKDMKRDVSQIKRVLRSRGVSPRPRGRPKNV